MNPQRLILALVVALGVSGLFTWWLSKKFSKPVAAAPARHQYVAAAVNLEAGEMLRPASLNLIDWPETTPLQGAFVKPEEVAGRIVMFPLSAGQPILERQLSAPGSASGLSVKIPEGMRAISLKSDDVIGVAGFLLPGTYVDVLVTYHTAATSEPITATILQDVQVLAAGQKFQPDPEGKAVSVDVVTLLVKPEDAERVVLASSQGMVHFVLRNGTDKTSAKETAIQLSQLDGGAPARPVSTSEPRPVRSVPPPYTVEIITGGNTAAGAAK
jgi:pilus assembly protein CpaB